MSEADPSAEAASADASAIAVLDALFALVRRAAVSGEPGALEQSALELHAALSAAQPPFSLQFLPEAVLRDRVPLPLSLEAHRRAQQCIGALSRLGANELLVDAVPPAPALIELGAALLHATREHAAEWPATLDGIRIRMLRPPRADAPGDQAGLDRLATAQLEQARIQAERLRAGAGAAWPWRQARALCRRLEQCMTASVSVTARALELQQAPWSPARRAVACAFQAGAVLARLQVSPLSQRAAMHAALAVAVHGLREREGLPFAAAAQAAARALLAGAAHSPLDPHHLRTCALTRMASRSETASAALVPLLHAVYELERRRCPVDLQCCLSRLDLQAWLAEALGREAHERFGRALLGVFGLVPIGSHVLADGRLTVVVGGGDRGDAFCPRVLLAGDVVLPGQPVALHSPLAMSPWAR